MEPFQEVLRQSLPPRQSSPRSSKRPRVSFASVTTREFAMGDEDPKKLSSPQERDLPPLADNSLSSEDKENVLPPEEEQAGHRPCMDAGDVCSTPEGARPRRDSGSGASSPRVEARLPAVGSRPSDGEGGVAMMTPVRLLLGDSSMILGSVADSLAGTPADVTAGILNFSQLVLDDELDALQRDGPSKATTELEPSGTSAATVGAHGLVSGVHKVSSTAPGSAVDAFAAAADMTPGAAPARGVPLELGDLPELPEDEFRTMKARDAFRDSTVRPSRGRLLDSPERKPGLGATGALDLNSAFDRAAISGTPNESDAATDGQMDCSGLDAADSPVPAHSTWVSIAGCGASDGSPTVDMGGVIGANASKRLSDAQRPLASSMERKGGEGPEGSNSHVRHAKNSFPEPQVPEGRRSFAAHLSMQSEHPTGELYSTVGCLDSSMSVLLALPTVASSAALGPTLGGIASDFAPLFPPLQTKAPEDLSGSYVRPLAPAPAGASSMGGPSLFSRPGGDGTSSSCGPGIPASLEITDPWRLSTTGASGDSSLPAKSSLHPILPLRGGEVSMLDCGSGVASISSDDWVWDKFLTQCGVSLDWPSQEQVDQLVSLLDIEARVLAAVPPGDCKRAQRAVDALAQQRAVCLQELIEQLETGRSAAQQQCDFAVRRWNDAITPPPLATEHQKASSSSPAELEVFKGKMQLLQSFCKERAMLRWHEMKNEWLAKDLVAVQQHTKALQQELSVLRDGEKRLDQISARIKTAVKQQRHRSDVRRTARQIRELGGEDLMATQDEQQFIQRKLPEMQASLDDERFSVEELERRVAHEREALERDRLEVREAQKRYLLQKAKRIALERERYAHTCNITGHTTASMVTFSLRGGAQVSFENAPANETGEDGSQVRVRLTLTPRGDDTCVVGLPLLRLQLFARAWRQVLGVTASGVVDAAEMKVTLPAGRVPESLQQLDLAAVRIADLVRTLTGLPSECPEVTRVSACLQVPSGDASGSVAKLAITVSLLVVRSHSLEEDGVLRPRNVGSDPLCVDGSCCELMFLSELPTFPEVNLSDMAVKRIFGWADAGSLLRALQGGRQRSHLSEALTGAAELLKRMAPAPRDTVPVRRA